LLRRAPPLLPLGRRRRRRSWPPRPGQRPGLMHRAAPRSPVAVPPPHLDALAVAAIAVHARDTAPGAADRPSPHTHGHAPARPRPHARALLLVACFLPL
jgi:hypothetical protein